MPNSRLDEAIASLKPLDTRHLRQVIWERIQHPNTGTVLPRLGRDETSVDLFVDIVAYGEDEDLSERIRDTAGELLKELSALGEVPDVKFLSELCTLCGQTGSRNSLDGLSALIERDDVNGLLPATSEPLRLRALRCLVGLLAHFQNDIETAPYRRVIEKCLQLPSCEKMALIGLTGLWPAEAARYTCRIGESRRLTLSELRFGLELAGFDRALEHSGDVLSNVRTILGVAQSVESS